MTPSASLSLGTSLSEGGISRSLAPKTTYEGILHFVQNDGRQGTRHSERRAQPAAKNPLAECAWPILQPLAPHIRLLIPNNPTLQGIIPLLGPPIGLLSVTVDFGIVAATKSIFSDFFHAARNRNTCQSFAIPKRKKPNAYYAVRNHDTR